MTLQLLSILELTLCDFKLRVEGFVGLGGMWQGKEAEVWLQKLTRGLLGCVEDLKHSQVRIGIMHTMSTLICNATCMQNERLVCHLSCKFFGRNIEVLIGLMGVAHKTCSKYLQ